MVLTFHAPFLVFGGLDHNPKGEDCTGKVGTIWPMDLVFMSTFDNQSMSIGCDGKLGGQSGFLRHYLLKEHV